MIGTLNRTTGPPATRFPVAGLCVAQLMVSLDGTIVTIALPSIQADLGLSPAMLQWIANGYLLSFAGLLMFGGRMADVLGRRRTFLIGVALFTTASAVGGLVMTGPLLIVARVLQGVGAAVLSPATVSLLTATFVDPDERRRALGAWTAAATSGNALGTLLGGVLTQLLDWHWVLLVNVPIGVALFAVAVQTFPADRPSSPSVRALDIPGTITVSLGLAAVVYGSVSDLTALAVGVVLLGLFVVIELRSKHQLLPLRLFRIRPVLCANILVMLLGAAMTAMFYFMSQYLQAVLHLSPLQAGLAFLPSSLGMILGSQLGARLLPRVGSRWLLGGAGTVLLGGVLWLSRMPIDGSLLVDVLVPMFVTGTSLGMVFVPNTTASVQGVSQKEVGVASGVFGSTQRVGSSLGLAVLAVVAASQTAAAKAVPHASAVVAAANGYQYALLGSAAVLVVSLVVSLTMPQLGVRAATGRRFPR